PNSNWRDTSIWYLKAHCGLNKVGNFMKDIGQKLKVKLLDRALTNHSGRKTAAQILQDANIPEEAIMEFTGHKSLQGLRAYKSINKDQKINTMKTLVNNSHVNFNTNAVTAQDVNMVQGQIYGEFQNQ
ncbi:16217_t:CDS:2, partial [Gigaspora margarita]